MLTLIATKLPHYLLPVWPALALAVGGTLAARNLDERDLRWLRRGAWLFAPVALLEAAGLFVVVWRPPVAELRWPCLALALVILGTAFAALRRHLGGDLAQGARLLCGGTALALAIAAARGLNISKGQRLELVALARNLPPNERRDPELR